MEHAAGQGGPNAGPRFIHLLYVPTDTCSLRCSYCYLDHDLLCGKGAEDPASANGPDPLDTLAHAVGRFRDAGIVPFNISLHGGEVTCLPPEKFERLVAYIDRYYQDNAALIRSNGFKVGKPHIKTNLYGIDRHLDALARHEVSVSGSLDVPFSLHRRFRKTADGRDTLDKILANVELLRGLPCKKKVSTTVFREHLDRIDEMIRDLRWLHENTCLDMNDFNFMFGFADSKDRADGTEHTGLTPLTEDEQVTFYRRMHAAFDGTELDAGVNGAWFAEFTPSYCTGSVNCGEKFFLLDWRGDVYSCVRGQGHEKFKYGNIFEDSVEEILRRAKEKIFMAHNEAPLSDDCAACPYLHLCMTGCPFVKALYGADRSYTCKLQQEIYRNNPDLYRPAGNPALDAFRYASRMRPLQAERLRPKPTHALPRHVPALTKIIENDPGIQGIFDDEAFFAEIDGARFRMESQVLRTSRQLVSIARDSRIRIYAREDIFDAACRWPVNNSLYLMLLSGELVTYGDENRTKQEHVATHQVFYRSLAAMPSDMPGFFCFDASALVSAYYDCLSGERPNNLFATTSALRDAHYSKHKSNAYYHIQTVNLPFPNIELLCEDERPPQGVLAHGREETA